MMKLTQRLAIGYIRTKFKVINLLSKKQAAQKAFELFCTPYNKVKPGRVPVHAQSLQFKLDLPGKSLTIKGYRWNHPQPHKVLILHGFGSAGHKFEAYVAPLVKKGYEVLAFDAPAHGRSSGRRTNAVEYSAMIGKVMQEFGPINGFIAHSFGGIAISLALEEMPHDANTKVVLIAPATETSTAADHAFELLKLKDETVRKEFDRIIFETAGRPVSWYSIRRAVKNIRASILWVHDEDDNITPLSDALKVKADNHPHIDFVITKGLGHQKIYRDSAVKKQVCSFL